VDEWRKWWRYKTKVRQGSSTPKPQYLSTVKGIFQRNWGEAVKACSFSEDLLSSIPNFINSIGN